MQNTEIVIERCNSVEIRLNKQGAISGGVVKCYGITTKEAFKEAKKYSRRLGTMIQGKEEKEHGIQDN